MDEIRPVKLYKYRHWNDNTKKILINNELYFQSAENFNDPFDANIILDMDATPAEWISRAVLLHNHYGGEMPKSEYQKMCSVLYHITEEERAYFSKNVTELVTQEVRKNTGIYCFTKSEDNILMWSHYANEHKGICLEFDHSAPALFSAAKVNYCFDYPKVNYFTSTYDELMNIRYFTKAKDWEYEQEYRIVIPDFSSQIKAIESQIITGAICGCCMPDEDIKEVIAILQDRPTPTMLYKAEKKKYGLGLDIVPIKQYGNI